MDSLPRSTASSRGLLPRSRDVPRGSGPFYFAPCLRAFCAWSHTGSLRFLQNPARTFAPLSDPGQSGSASPVAAVRCRPQIAHAEVTNIYAISGLNHAASMPAVYASSNALLHSHARLASGWWLAFAGRDSNPLDSTERFPPYCPTSSFHRFILTLALPAHPTIRAI